MALPQRLCTLIAPRRDGTVRVMDARGAMHVFAPDVAGSLVCTLEDEALAAKLLATGAFVLLDAQAISEPRKRSAPQAMKGERHGALGGLSS